MANTVPAVIPCVTPPEPVQEQLVTLEEAQGAVENIEQGEGITGVIRLVCQPLDQALLPLDVLFRSANAVLDDSKAIAFGSHLIAPQRSPQAPPHRDRRDRDRRRLFGPDQFGRPSCFRVAASSRHLSPRAASRSLMWSSARFRRSANVLGLSSVEIQ